MKVLPFRKRVLVKPVEGEEKTSGGVYLPQEEKEKTNRGEVVAVGDELKELKLAKGDIVLFEAYAGHDFKENGTKYVILHAKDILAKMEK